MVWHHGVLAFLDRGRVSFAEAAVLTDGTNFCHVCQRMGVAHLQPASGCLPCMLAWVGSPNRN